MILLVIEKPYMESEITDYQALVVTDIYKIGSFND